MVWVCLLNGTNTEFRLLDIREDADVEHYLQGTLKELSVACHKKVADNSSQLQLWTAKAAAPQYP